MKRPISSLIVLLAAITLAATGCEKGGTGVNAESSNILSYLPKKSSFVVGFSWAKLRSSAMFKKSEKEVMSNLPPEISKLKEMCGIDVMTDIKTIVLALGENPEDKSQMYVAIKGNLDEQKVTGCLEKLGLLKDGELEVEGDRLYTYWPSADTVLLSQNDPSAMKKATADGSLKDNAELMKMVGKVDSSATIWGAGLLSGGPLAAMAGPMGLKGGYLSLKIESGLGAKLGVAFESDSQASAAALLVNAQLSKMKDQASPFKDVLDAIEIENSGDTIIAKLKLSNEQLESMKKMGGNLPF